jgi:hypothetical protein
MRGVGEGDTKIPRIVKKNLFKIFINFETLVPYKVLPL